VANRGKDFEREFRNSVNAYPGVYCYRITDKVYIGSDHKPHKTESPADFYVFDHRFDRLVVYMVECKATASRTSISFSALAEHQGRDLKSFDDMHDDMRSFVAVNFYDSINLRRFNEMYLIPLARWRYYEENLGRKSVARKTLMDDDDVILCKREGTLYDISGVFGSR